jgi:hypothetical protein
MANVVRPAAQRTATTIRRAATSTAGAVGPAVTKVKVRSQEAARHLREAATRRFE